MAQSDVCVVMSTYNGEKYLREQVESLEGQSLVPARIHIRDDGSTDGTRQLIEELASEYANITYAFCENIGWRLGFIDALKQCGDGYDWYSFCDQDDVWLPEKLEMAVALLEGRSPVDVPVLYAGNATIADAKLEPIRLFNKAPVDIVGKDFPHTFTMDEMAGGLTYVFNRIARELLVGFRYPGVTGHDRLLMLICKLFGNVVYDFNSYVLYRQHGSNAIGGIAPHPVKLSFAERVRNALRPDERQRGTLAKGLLAIDDDLHRLAVEERGFLRLCADCKERPSARIQLVAKPNIGSYCRSQEIKLRIRILLGSY